MSEEAIAEESVEEVVSEETSSEEAPAAEEAPAEEVAAEEIKSKLEKFILKVDGEDVEDEIDLSNREEIIKRLQLAKVAQKRMQQYAELEKLSKAKDKDIEGIREDVDSFLQGMKNDPVSILSDPALGLNLTELTKMLAQHALTEAEKSPEQKRLEEAEAKAAKLEQLLKEESEKKDRERYERKQNEMATEMENQIQEAIASNQIPKDTDALKKVAWAMKVGLKYGINLEVKDVVPIVKKQMYEEAKSRLGILTEDEIEEFIGAEKFTNIRKKYLKQLKKEVPSVNNIRKTSEAAEKSKESADPFARNREKPISSKEFFKNLGKSK